MRLDHSPCARAMYVTIYKDRYGISNARSLVPCRCRVWYCTAGAETSLIRLRLRLHWTFFCGRRISSDPTCELHDTALTRMVLSDGIRGGEAGCIDGLFQVDHF